MSGKNCEGMDLKEKILQVALQEFAQNGYKAASTNVICKKAEVSKGLLYHYYNSKENLYIYSIKHAIDKFKENINISINSSKNKGIDYVTEYFNAKFKYFRENPLYSKIIVNSLLNDEVEEAKKLSNEFQEYNNSLIYEVIKKVNINPKFDKDKAFELIVMIGEKLEEKHMKDIENKDKDTAVEEFREDHKIMLEMVFEGIDK